MSAVTSSSISSRRHPGVHGEARVQQIVAYRIDYTMDTLGAKVELVDDVTWNQGLVGHPRSGQSGS